MPTSSKLTPTDGTLSHGHPQQLQRPRDLTAKAIRAAAVSRLWVSLFRAKLSCGIWSDQVSTGLHPSLLRALLLHGYQTPTPIQRLAIPSLISSPPRDLVGMARTGSGKTLAYVVPLIQRLGGRHSSAFGARAVILVPTRELALQIVKVGKDLSRGWNKEGVSHAGDARDKRETSSCNLRWSLIVGGDNLDDQFNTIANNPDV